MNETIDSKVKCAKTNSSHFKDTEYQRQCNKDPEVPCDLRFSIDHEKFRGAYLCNYSKLDLTFR